MKKERLDKILALNNFGSRREVGDAVRRGRVSVDGRIVRKPDFKISPDEASVLVDGVPAVLRLHLYLMMNKPAGVLSASRDPASRTVVDLLPRKWKRRGVFPAGRLDRDTQGLLIITDDGDFAHRMLSPKNHVWKRYEAELAFPVSPEDTAAFQAGIRFQDRTCLPARLEVISPGPHPLAGVEIREGKFHQVKRMFLARGNRVLRLRRVRIGNLELDSALAPGQAREMTERERQAVFMESSAPE